MSVFDDFMREKGIPTDNPENGTFTTYKTIERILGNYKIGEMSQLELIELFKAMSIKTASRFNTVKSQYKMFAEWAVTNGIMTQAQVESIKDVAFSDIEDLSITQEFYIASLDELFYLFQDGGLDAEQYDTFKAAVLLCWYGIEPSRIIDVEKQNITDYGIAFDGKSYPVEDERVLKLFLKYSKASTYTTEHFGRESILYYKDSKYLLRSYRNDHLTYKQLRASTSKLSKEKLKKQISLGKVWESGNYYRLLMDERQNGEVKPGQIERITGFCGVKPSGTAASNKLKDFKRWKRAFYESEEKDD